MRTFKTFFTELVRKPPAFFPIVALFHILWLSWTVWDDRYIHFPSIEWLQVLWIAGYALFWFAATDLKKWGAIGYIFLTVLDVSLNFAVKNHKVSVLYVSNMFLIDVILSFVLMLYYKRLE